MKQHFSYQIYPITLLLANVIWIKISNISDLEQIDKNFKKIISASKMRNLMKGLNFKEEIIVSQIM